MGEEEKPRERDLKRTMRERERHWLNDWFMYYALDSYGANSKHTIVNNKN